MSAAAFFSFSVRSSRGACGGEGAGRAEGAWSHFRLGRQVRH